ncbi:hypothetical protein [Kiloniella sp. b19]|uniref:hypothetical protein n=1 Tax=Kiloniella sp. GXU_MW_B19 TaxID=3141326 RepID=UPI0031D522CB
MALRLDEERNAIVDLELIVFKDDDGNPCEEHTVFYQVRAEKVSRILLNDAEHSDLGMLSEDGEVLGAWIDDGTLRLLTRWEDHPKEGCFISAT